MKRNLLVACVLLSSGILFAQTSVEVLVKPDISNATIASNIKVAGSRNIRTTGKTYGSVVVGQGVFGKGIPFGTTVTALVDPALDSIITLSRASTTTDTVHLDFGYYRRDTSAVGDYASMPFLILARSSSQRILDRVTIQDTSVLGSKFNILLESSDGGYFAWGGLTDTIATVWDATNFVGYVKAGGTDTVSTAGGTTTDMRGLNIVLPPQVNLYGRLIHQTAGLSYRSLNPVWIKFYFKL